jgi:hypothetical protein
MFSAFFDTSVFGFKKPIHGTDRTMIIAFIKKRGVYLIRRIITEMLGMKDIDHRLALSRAQGQRR